MAHATPVPAAEHPGQPSARRLNPFAFPSDTDFRFGLLVVAVIAASLFLYNWLSTAELPLSPGRSLLLTAAARCLPLAPAGIGPDPLAAAFGDRAAFDAAGEAYRRCLAPLRAHQAAWMVGGLAVLLAVAALACWSVPAWKIRRQGLQPLDPRDAADVLAELELLSRTAGLVEPPTFLLDPRARTAGGQAFGRPGRHYVALSAPLLTSYYLPGQRAAFRAIVLHELAHLRNADVDKTYFSLALVASFVAVALTPFVLTLLDEDTIWVLDVGWRVAVLGGLVALTLASVLRARELYADVRASTWDEGDAVEHVLARLPPPGQVGWPRRPLRLHPDPSERRATVADTRPLFRPAVWEAFGTGLALGIAAPYVVRLLAALTADAGQSILAPTLAAAVFAPALAGILWLGIWRTTFAALALGRRPDEGRPSRLALGFGAGVAAGYVVAFERTLDRTLLPNIGVVILTALFWTGLLVPCAYLFTRWAAATAASWLWVAASGRAPRHVYLPALAAASVVLVAGLGVLLAVYELLFMASFSPLYLLLLVPAVVFLYLTSNALITLPLVGIWATPLAAWWFRGRTASPARADWAYLDEPGTAPAGPVGLAPTPAEATTELARLPVRDPRRALRAGLLAGCAYALVLLGYRLGLRLLVPEAERNTDAALVQFYLLQVVAAAVLEVGVAGFVARRVHPLGVYHGLLAAFAAGCSMVVALLGLNLLFGGTLDGGFVWQTFTLVVNLGTLLALLPAALAAATRPRAPGEGQPLPDETPTASRRQPLPAEV